jgi:hypothetical protein
MGFVAQAKKGVSMEPPPQRQNNPTAVPPRRITENHGEQRPVGHPPSQGNDTAFIGQDDECCLLDFLKHVLLGANAAVAAGQSCCPPPQPRSRVPVPRGKSGKNERL